MNGFAHSLGLAFFFTALTGPVQAQFVADPTAPTEASATDNVDFADVDLDGDWDAAFADGGETGLDQNRLWRNQGGSQGGVLGAFLDTTDVDLPAVSDTSRDVEFVDLDGDLDVDLYISNTAQIVNQFSRFWINQGGLQGGALGSYQDDTAARWVGLGGPGSSIAQQLLMPNAVNPEGFIDWSCDSDFADLDNDGDMDLFHSSYGGAFGGEVPSRIFLNDGAGYFQEHNPSGFQLVSQNIANGNPGLWALGVQMAGTTESDGSECDIASNGVDLELMDIDGDLDIDLLLGSRDTPPRLFTNQLEQTGSLVFKDVSEELFPPDWATGGGHYEQEMGDVDLDGDMDLFGLNWSAPFSDKILFNDGTGHFGDEQVLPDSSADDNEGDYLDYDSDGDLDLYVANWSGANRLYRNQFVETGSVDYVLQETGLMGGITLDADAADVDGDGDPDLIDAMATFVPNVLLINTYDIPDTHAPYFAGLEIVADDAAEAGDDPVRAAVLDNASYYTNWYMDVALDLSIDGISVPSLPMVSSGGQLFRAEIPANLVGAVSYRVTAADQYGNTASSSAAGYTNSGNSGAENGASTFSSLGVKPRLRGLSEAIAGEPAYIAVDGVAPGTLGVVVPASGTIAPLNLGDGLVITAFPFSGNPMAVVANGSGVSTLVGNTQPGLAGTTVYLQYFGMDGAGANTWASSNRLRLDF